jgi:hypothetical protein
MPEKPKKCHNHYFSLLICMVAPTCDVMRGDLRSPRTTSLDTTRPIHNILSTDPQLSISQKALGTLHEGGNVMLKHVGAIIHN